MDNGAPPSATMRVRRAYQVWPATGASKMVLGGERNNF
jgi:hypothetical protein